MNHIVKESLFNIQKCGSLFIYERTLSVRLFY